MSKVFKDLLLQYNEAVANVSDLEKALKTLIGKDDWEATVLSDTSISVQVLYDELKKQRNIREDLEAKVYSEPEDKPSSDAEPSKDSSTEDTKANAENNSSNTQNSTEQASQ